MSEIDHKFTNEIVCPYCGYEFSDSWEYLDPSNDSHDGEEIDVECLECGKNLK